MTNCTNIRTVSYFVLISVFFSFTVPSSFATNIIILGEVIPAGQTEVMTESGSWQGFDNIMPIVSGDRHTYKTSDGKITLVLFDDVRFEAAENTIFTVVTKEYDHPVELEWGELTLGVPGGASLTVMAPGLKIIISRDMRLLDENAIVIVSHDGEKSVVNCIRGKMQAINILNGEEVMLVSGASYSVTLDDDFKKALAAMSDQAGVAGVTAEKGGISNALKIALGAVLAGAMIALAGSGGGGGGGGGGGNGTASPSSP